jgi:hypothetical protein
MDGTAKIGTNKGTFGAFSAVNSTLLKSNLAYMLICEFSTFSTILNVFDERIWRRTRGPRDYAWIGHPTSTSVGNDGALTVYVQVDST